MKRNRIFHWLYMVLLIIFVCSGVALAVRSAQMQAGNVFYENLCEVQDDADRAPDCAASMEETSLLSDGVEDEEREMISDRAQKLSGRVTRLAKKYPDIAAWLQIPGTSVDYPVMRGADHLFYLDHLPDGSRNALGSLFVDCRCAGESRHVIIYGHNGSGGKMFGGLKLYESRDYLEKHGTVIFAARDGVYVCPVFSVRMVEAGGPAYKVDFEDAGSLANYIGQAAGESLCPVETDTGGAAGVLTLSTCTGWYRKRLIVQALLPPSFSGLT